MSGGRIRIAVIDPGTLWCIHPSFRDSSTGSRILTRKTCSTTGCVVDDSEVCSTNDDGYTHGTAVSFLALGDYLDGQVSTLSATTRELLTSAAHEANLLYYRVPFSTSNTTFGDRVEAALEQAVTDGADIVVMSFALQVAASSFESQLCSTTYNPGGINATLKNVVDAGAVIFKSSGNESEITQYPGICNVTFPGYRPEVIAINGLSSFTSIDYSDTNRFPLGSFGTMSLSQYGGGSMSYFPVGLVAPAIVKYLPSGPDCSPVGGGVYEFFSTWLCTLTESISGGSSGTSWAAPAAAGGFANVLDSFESYFSSTGWGWSRMTHAFLFGDNYDGEQIIADGYLSNAPGLEDSTGPAETTGFGRFRAHYNSSDSWGSIGLMGYTYFTLTDGATYDVELGNSGVENSTPHHIKAVVFAPDFDLQNVPQFIVRVINVCPAGGGSPVTVRSLSSHAIRRGVHLFPEDISGRCLKLRLIGTAIPPGGITMHVAAYRYNNDADLH